MRALNRATVAVVVRGASTSSCAGVVDAERGVGLLTVMVRLACRLGCGGRSECAEPGVMRSRLRGVKAVRGGLMIAVLMLAVGGCGAEEPEPLCPVDRMGITAGMDGVRVANRSGAACRFRGSYPVSMQVRLAGAGPPAAEGVLPASGTYVQPYVAGTPAACPPPERNTPRTIAASVEGVQVRAVTRGADAYFMATCSSFTAGVPRIEG